MNVTITAYTSIQTVKDDIHINALNVERNGEGTSHARGYVSCAWMRSLPKSACDKFPDSYSLDWYAELGCVFLVTIPPRPGPRIREGFGQLQFRIH